MDLEVNAIRIHCELTGDEDAPWLVCLHSLATDCSIWEAQVAAFASAHRLLRVDLRGHGGSEATPAPYSCRLLVDDVVAVFDELGIDQADVVGLSLGSIVGMGLGIEQPERVRSLVVADARADAPPDYVRTWETVIARAERNGLAPVVDMSLERWFTADFLVRRPEVVERVRQVALRTPLDGLVGAARAVQGLAYLPQLGCITAPTLFVTGAADPVATPEIVADMASRVAGAQLVVIPSAAHLTPVEQPDAFSEAVIGFLSGAGQGASL